MFFAVLWTLTIYAVDTHAIVLRLPHYQALEFCEADGKAYAVNGKTYAVCSPG